MMDNRLFQPAPAIKNFLSDSPMGEAHGTSKPALRAPLPETQMRSPESAHEPADPLRFFRRGVLKLHHANPA